MISYVGGVYTGVRFDDMLLKFHLIQRLTQDLLELLCSLEKPNTLLRIQLEAHGQICWYGP